MQRTKYIVALLLIMVAGCQFTKEGIQIQWNWGGNQVKPQPNPDPVTPVVVPPRPVDVHEFYCLVLHDPKADRSLTPTQLSMLYSKNTRDFMKANAKGYEVLDGSPDYLKTITGVWKQIADANPPKELPWVIMVNGTMKPIAKPLQHDWAEWKADCDSITGVMP